jgi:hypothetical protein
MLQLAVCAMALPAQPSAASIVASNHDRANGRDIDVSPGSTMTNGPFEPRVGCQERARIHVRSLHEKIHSMGQRPRAAAMPSNEIPL